MKVYKRSISQLEEKKITKHTNSTIKKNVRYCRKNLIAIITFQKAKKVQKLQVTKYCKTVNVNFSKLVLHEYSAIGKNNVERV